MKLNNQNFRGSKGAGFEEGGKQDSWGISVTPEVAASGEH